MSQTTTPTLSPEQEKRPYVLGHRVCGVMSSVAALFYAWLMFGSLGPEVPDWFNRASSSIEAVFAMLAVCSAYNSFQKANQVRDGAR